MNAINKLFGFAVQNIPTKTTPKPVAWIQMNDLVTVRCVVCNHDIPMHLDTALEALVKKKAFSTSNGGVWRCSKECRDLYEINPLAYDKECIDINAEIFRILRVKFEV